MKAERRFDRSAWLGLITAGILLLWSPALTLAGFRYPSDGWTSRSVNDRYVLHIKTTDQPSLLKAGDVILAIDGQNVTTATWPPLPTDLAAGRVMHYTVLRNQQALAVEVPLVRRPPAALVVYLLEQARIDVSQLLVPLLSLLIAAFTFFARPRNDGARLLFLIFMFFFGVNWFAFADLHLYIWSYPPLPLVLNGLSATSWAWFFFPTFIQFALVFPVRKWPMRHFPRLLPVLLYGIPATLSTVSTVLMVLTHDRSWERIPVVTLFVWAILFVTTVFGTLIHNVKTVHEPVWRAQVRWMALGLGGGWGLPLILAMASFAFPHSILTAIVPYIGQWLGLIFPLALSIAITRHRLFDIDVIIRRTLVYTLLSATLALIYLGGVVVLQRLLAPLAGESNQIAVVASTLAIVALFQPLRRRIQAIIDRRFYRRKYDAARTLEAFNARVRDQVELSALTDEVIDVVQDTLQPAHVSLWLRPMGRN